jgi:hypothetical protein
MRDATAWRLEVPAQLDTTVGTFSLHVRGEPRPLGLLVSTSPQPPAAVTPSDQGEGRGEQGLPCAAIINALSSTL